MLNRLWQTWRRLGQWLGDRVARLVLTVFYFTIAVPFGILVRLTQDPLDVRGSSGGWVRREREEPTLADAGKLF